MINYVKNKIRNFFQQRAAILMYHQVCEKRSDPWELAVNPERFAEQLYHLKRNYTVVSIEELAHHVVRKKLHPNMVAVTFDDGFADNITFAAPILECYNIPATFYISTDVVSKHEVYWWDELQEVILHTPRLPEKFEMVVGHEIVSFEFHSDSVLNAALIKEIREWNATMPQINERLKLYYTLWEKLKPLTHQQQRNVLKKIQLWAGIHHCNSSDGLTMNLEDIKQLSNKPLFSVGAHTVHHAMLAEQNETEQAYEINESKSTLEKWLGKKITGFAYPYGNYNTVTKALIKQMGFEYAVSTNPCGLTVNSDPFALPRLQVKNWDVKEFSSKLARALN